MRTIELAELPRLFGELSSRGYRVIGPTFRDGTVVFDDIRGIEDLPTGCGETVGPASYKVSPRDDGALFGYWTGASNWRRFLIPPRLSLFSAVKSGRGFAIVPPPAPSAHRPLAFVGIRPCDLSALLLYDRVYLQGDFIDGAYKAARGNAFVVAVNCVGSGENCFCASMGTGPAAKKGFDIALTEVIQGETHHFTAESGSDRGKEVLEAAAFRKAAAGEAEAARSLVARGAKGQGKSIDVEDLPRILNENFDNPVWDDVARRCLSCANCTMVCPTCFCSTVEDTTDLSGNKAGRTRRWDSCFSMEFSRVAGGNTRPSVRARYRQWLTHKLSYWTNQFGAMGCVGCGRCVTWCPAGIDLTAEVGALRETLTH
jgi:sulfhydrogenase subunit beta (sulfur reductase)